MSVLLLKKAIEEISCPLDSIVNTITVFLEVDFRMPFKVARVEPVFKKGGSSLVCNYHHIAVNPAIAKVSKTE